MSHHIDTCFSLFSRQAFWFTDGGSHKQFYCAIFQTLWSLLETGVTTDSLCLVLPYLESYPVSHVSDFIRDMTNCFGHISVTLVLCKTARVHWWLYNYSCWPVKALFSVISPRYEMSFFHDQKCSGFFISLLLHCGDALSRYVYPDLIRFHQWFDYLG